MDFLITQNLELLGTWPIEKRAAIPGGLPDRLSIKQIALLSAPQDTQKQNIIIKAIIKLCKEKAIEYFGDIEGWVYGGNEFSYIANPYEDIKGVQVEMGDLMRTALANKWKAAPADCLIDRCEFKRYLQSVNQSATGYLVNWWGNAEHQVEAVESESLMPAQNDLQKRIEVLQGWLNKQEYYKPGTVTVLPKGISHHQIHIILNKASTTDDKLFDMALETFKRHFWQKQKIARLKQGR